MELYQLEELAALAEYGSISKAADSIGVSQPAMSRSMKLLEEDIGVSIFQRTSNSIELNDTGRLAASLATGITSSVKKAMEEIRDFDRRKKTILVGSEAPAPLWSVVSQLSSIEEDKTVAGEMRESRLLIDGLKNGTYRYVITTEPIEIDGFATARLGEENLMFLLPENHRYASRKSLSFKELDGENMLLYERIGSWKDLPNKMMPSSRFLIQNDRESFEEIVMKSQIPSFVSDLLFTPIDGKIAVPISDKEAHVVFYISSRSKDYASLSYFARNFRAEFKAHHAYAI